MDIAIPGRTRSDLERLEREYGRRRSYIERRAHLRGDEPALLQVDHITLRSFQ